MESKPNVYQRLLNVRKSVSYLKKDAKNQKQGFDYVSSSQTLGNLKKEMDEQGLMLVPSIESYEVRDHETANKAHWYFTILDMTFTWVNVDDPDDKVISKWAGHGLDSGEKSVGKAATYAEKYFLLKFFNIATDSDDPDAFEKKHDGSGKAEIKNKLETKDKPKNDKAPTKTRIEKIETCRQRLGDMNRLKFEEGNDGAMLRYKVENQSEVNKGAAAMLKKLTAFEGKGDKDDFPGFDSIKALESISDDWFNAAYGKIAKAHEVWQEKYDNSNE